MDDNRVVSVLAVLVSFVIYAIGMADGRPVERFVKSYDPAVDIGWEDVGFTDDVQEAMHFDSMAEAATLWKEPSKRYPIRVDGKPNRPLTAFTIDIRRIP